jgi:hypothetical protein
MKSYLKIQLIILFLLPVFSGISEGQDHDTTFHLLTCGPGTELYSIYGHSALLVTINSSGIVYNWGVFDFNAPNFAWKFAKGRLNYWLGSDNLRGFLESYLREQRYVISQKINLLPAEERTLMELINENMKPENKSYRYDFFYDDCSTRIRDLLEKATNKSLVYPPEPDGELPTFRQMVAKYQSPLPWVQFGVDLLMGAPGDKPANVRDRMFLPLDLMEGLSETTVNRGGNQENLLESKVFLIDLPAPDMSPAFFETPLFVFSILLVIVSFMTLIIKSRAYNNLLDYILFSVFAILAAMMIFFNFFTDHEQMRYNYNILWLNPFLIISFFAVLFNRGIRMWFRVVFFMTVFFLAIHLLLPQAFNIAIYPLILIILFRSFARSDFSWNPVSAFH